MSKPPTNLASCGVKFLGDGYLVIAYPEAEVTQMWSGSLMLTVPVAYYSEEWDWLDGGVIFLGAETHENAVEEASNLLGLTSLTSSPRR